MIPAYKNVMLGDAGALQVQELVDKRWPVMTSPHHMMKAINILDITDYRR